MRAEQGEESAKRDRRLVVPRGVARGLAFAVGLSWIASPFLYFEAVFTALVALGEEGGDAAWVTVLLALGLGLPTLLTVAMLATRQDVLLESARERFAQSVREYPSVRRLTVMPSDATWRVGPLATMDSARCVAAASFDYQGVSGTASLLSARRPGEPGDGTVHFAMGVAEGDFDAEPLTLVGPDVDPHAWGLEGDLVDLRPYGVVAPWRALASSPDVAARALNSRVVERLNGTANEGIVVHRRSDRVLAWQDPAAELTLFPATFGLAAFANAWRMDADDASAAHDASALEEASVGRVVSRSRVDTALGVVMFYSGITAFVAGLLAYGTLFSTESTLNPGPVVAASIPLALISAAVVGILWRVVSRTAQRRKAFALDVRRFANARGWDYAMNAKELARAWATPPLSHVSNLSISPVARGAGRWGAAGAAFAMGDFTTAGIPVRTFQSHMAWAHLAEESAPVSIVREGFSQRAATLLGGSDVDVESAEFNRLWRVLSHDHRAAHAMLTPTMIHFLTEIADEGLAFHVDGDRVLLWDDGRRIDVDLTRRMELLERFVGALPSYLRVRYAPYPQE